MPIDFPDSPVVNDTFTLNGRTWEWNGTTWDALYVDARNAYQIALDNGFVGTEQEWLDSLNANYPATAVSSNITMTSSNRYFVDTSTAITLTLPASPALGDEVIIYDAAGQASVNNITVLRNGSLINGLADDALIDLDQYISVFTYTGSTLGWRFE